MKEREWILRVSGSHSFESFLKRLVGLTVVIRLNIFLLCFVKILSQCQNSFLHLNGLELSFYLLVLWNLCVLHAKALDDDALAVFLKMRLLQTPSFRTLIFLEVSVDQGAMCSSEGSRSHRHVLLWGEESAFRKFSEIFTTLSFFQNRLCLASSSMTITAVLYTFLPFADSLILL